jgi:heme/copper-type cytochrome/quinol oxidase subunit 4
MTTRSNLRFDFAFSYWILVWFLLYYNKLISYNPKIWLILALAFVSIVFILLLYYQNSSNYVILFVFVSFVIKIIPLWLLRKTSIKSSDFLFGLSLYMFYQIWLHICGSSYYMFLHDSFEAIKANIPATPAEYYLLKLIY